MNAFEILKVTRADFFSAFCRMGYMEREARVLYHQMVAELSPVRRLFFRHRLLKGGVIRPCEKVSQ